jgi:hypothetical protein
MRPSAVPAGLVPLFGPFSGLIKRFMFNLGMHKSTEQDMDEKLGRLAELYYQQFDSGYRELCRPFGAKAVPDQLESELEVSDEMLALSKEVATYYTPLIEKLVAAGVLTVRISQPTEEDGVFEIGAVIPLGKSYFNEGKILLFTEEEQINGEDGKLIPEFRKRLGRFVAPWVPRTLDTAPAF